MDHHRQYPTHSCLRITSSNDAKNALFLVEAGVLERVRRRPDDAEKTLIAHGSVFVWRDGAKGETGLERWTDGRQWGPSRCRDDFLIYEEKDGPHPKLVKSTFTARRNTVGDSGALWHLIAYYYQHDVNSLRAPDTDPDYAPIVSRMPQGYFVSNRKDKSRKAKEVPPPVQQIAFNHPSPSPTSSHVPSSGIPTSVPLLSPIQTSAHQHPHHRPQLSVSVPTTPHDSAGAGYPRFGQDPYATSSYRDIPGPHAHRSGGGCGDESSSDIYSSSPSPSPGLSPASSGLSQDDRHDEPALIPNGGALHPSTAHHQNGIQHYYPGALPLSRNSVILPSIASLRVRITRGEQVLIDEVEGSARLGEDEKQLQKLNPTLSQLF